MITIQKENQTVLRFPEPMVCISSAILGGGIKDNVRTVANATLSQDDYVPIDSMGDFCRDIISSCGFSADEAVVLLTSVPQKFLGQSDDGRCIATVGLGNACPLIPDLVWNEEGNKFQRYIPGTINCVITLNESLSPSALVEGYGVAKMAIAEIIGVWSSYRGINACFGTPTDCTAILSPQNGRQMKFAGLSTKIGSDIVRLTREAVIDAITYKYEDFRDYYTDLGKSR